VVAHRSAVAHCYRRRKRLKAAHRRSRLPANRCGESWDFDLVLDQSAWLVPRLLAPRLLLLTAFSGATSKKRLIRQLVDIDTW